MEKEEIKEILRKRLNYKIENMVCKAELGVKIPLSDFYEYLRKEIIKYQKFASIKYDPVRFPGLIVKNLSPDDSSTKISFLIFSSGKVVIAGIREKNQVNVMVDLLVKLVEGFGIKLEEPPKISLENVVLSGEFGVSLDIDALMYELENVFYEPEVFPGLITRFSKGDKNYTFLLFTTGRFVCTGVRKLEEIDEAMEVLIENLAEILENLGYEE